MVKNFEVAIVSYSIQLLTVHSTADWAAEFHFLCTLLSHQLYSTHDSSLLLNRPRNLVFSDVSFMAILAGVTPSESDKVRHSALVSENLTNNQPYAK